MPALLNKKSSRPKVFEISREHGVNRGRVRDIDGRDEGAARRRLPRRFLEGLPPPAGERDCVAGLAEGQGDGLADPRPGAGDERKFRVRAHAVSPLPSAPVRAARGTISARARGIKPRGPPQVPASQARFGAKAAASGRLGAGAGEEKHLLQVVLGEGLLQDRAVAEGVLDAGRAVAGREDEGHTLLLQ